MIRTARFGFAVSAIAAVAWCGPSLVRAQATVAPPTVDSAAAPFAPLVDLRRGNLPIIISAPHGGLEAVPDVPVRANRNAYRFVIGTDVNSRLLAQKLVADLERRLGGKPYYVMARFHRKYIDANRAPADAYESPRAKPHYDAYHGALEAYCREIQNQFGAGLLIDVHGQASFPDQLLVGTDGGKTVTLLRQRFGEEALVGERGIVGLLQAQGFKVVPAINAADLNVPKYNGGEIVQVFGSDRPKGIDAVQFEFGANFRQPPQLDATAEKAAAAVAEFYKTYVIKPAK